MVAEVRIELAERERDDATQRPRHGDRHAQRRVLRTVGEHRCAEVTRSRSKTPSYVVARDPNGPRGTSSVVCGSACSPAGK